MYFHFSKSVTILFKGWAVNETAGKLLLTCIIKMLEAETLGYCIH